MREVPFRARALILALLCGSVVAQSPPQHPRLLFVPAQIPGLQAKVSVTGSPAAQSFSSLVTSAGLQTGSSQSAYVVYRSLRRLEEVAFRYQLTGNPVYGDNAKSLLMTMVGYLTPTAAPAYLASTYPSSLAITFDMVYDRLSVSERAQVVSHLEAWVTAMRNGNTGWSSYSSYSAAVDNYIMGWSAGIALTLMAIEGDSNYPNLQGHIQQNLQMIRDGWRDVVSPDGSMDEWYGYMNYSHLYALNAAVAAIHCGYGDIVAGTNILRTPRWLATSLPGSSFTWVGDSSPTHKGTRVDPVIYYLLSRADGADSFGLHGVNTLMTLDPPGDNSPSWAFSPHVSRILFYPSNLQPALPEVTSGFFRDNLNEGSATGNKLAAYFGVGEGGHAFLHNSSDPSWTKLCNYYMIRDEWMNHNHEDDGHLSLAVNGQWLFLDMGYANQSSWFGGQSTDHNIVVVQGASGFNGNSNNYYSPPSTNGRFLGKKRTVLLSPALDYVGGDHRNMWMMQEADRTVLMVKDPTMPYTILLDNVNKNGSTQTFEELFHAGGSASGQGTISSPMTVSSGGSTVRSVWLAPSSRQLITGGSSTNAGMSFWRHRMVASGSDVTFLSVHGPSAPSALAPLVNPLATTHGGTLDFGPSDDLILASNGSTVIGDASTQADANLVWIRKVGGQVTSWAAGEAVSLVHGGQSFLTASERVSVSVRNGRVHVATESEAGGQGLSLTVWVPTPAVELVVDGTTVSFNQNGNFITLGTSGPTAFPSNSSDDRAYAFIDGWLWDAVAEGDVSPALGGVTSGQGWSHLVLKGGALVGQRPLAVGLDVNFLPNAVGEVADLEFRTSPGAGDVVRLSFARTSSSTFSAAVFQGAGAIGTASLPLGLLPDHGRLTAVLDPMGGTLVLEDGTGQGVQAFALTPVTTGFQVRVGFGSHVVLDNVTLFDSAEDGVTPQGVSFYANPNAVAGFAIRTPSLFDIVSWAGVQNGQFSEPWLTDMWFSVGGLDEVVVDTYAPPGVPLPGSLKEGCWEFAIPSVHTDPGHSTGIWLQRANGTQLLGQVSY